MSNRIDVQQLLDRARAAYTGSWTGVLAVEDTTTVDGRIIAPEALTFVDRIPLRFLLGGIFNYWIGRVNRVWRDGDLIKASGVLDLEHPEAAKLVARITPDTLTLPVAIDVDAAEWFERDDQLTLEEGILCSVQALEPAAEPPWPESVIQFEAMPAGTNRDLILDLALALKEAHQ